MKKIILVSGIQNSGKSNTIGLLYESLVKINPSHTFNDSHAKSSQIKFPIGKNEDFSAIFNLKEYFRIGLLSCGDDLDMFKTDFSYIKDDIDVLICASRSKNADGSVYKFITEEMPSNGFLLQLNLSTFPTDNLTEMQRNIVNAILKFLNL